MKLRHFKQLKPAEPGIARVVGVSWSRNNKKMAFVDCKRVLHMFDDGGEHRDAFTLNRSAGTPGDMQTQRPFVIRDVCFSPQSNRIAVAQSDGMLYVYKVGLEWGERKSVVGKFISSSPINCMCWPGKGESDTIVFGCQDGKIRSGQGQKTKTEFEAENGSPCVAISACSADINGFVSAHMDGSIYRFLFEPTDDLSAGVIKIATHSCPPYALSWGGRYIAAAGADCRVVFFLYDQVYNEHQKSQCFEHNAVVDKEFTVAQFHPGGQTLVVACWNRLRLYNFNMRQQRWEEGEVKELPNMFRCTSLDWKPDGSKLTIANTTGAVDIFDAYVKKYRYEAFEFTYLSTSQVIVKRLLNQRRVILKPQVGLEILKINVRKGRYLIAHTESTLLVGDLDTYKLSEVSWTTNGNERFFFDNEHVALVLQAGEISIIEYGRNDILGSFTTDYTGPHQSSIRILMTPTRDIKIVAYLLDRKTIRIDDIITGTSKAHISHNSKVDWLELNKYATKLLFRDKQRQLFIFDISTQQKCTMLNFCTYVQWVPNADVVVAQTRGDLCVWYCIDNPDQVAVFPIKGDVKKVERSGGKTEVVVDEANDVALYCLNESLIEFGGAMEDKDYERACTLLEQIQLVPETEAMWQTLSQIALNEGHLHVAERCFAALGDICKATALSRINEMAMTAVQEGSAHSPDGYDHYTVVAALHILNKDFKRAESVYEEHNQTDLAMGMWEELYRLDESISIAQRRNHPNVAQMRVRYFDWLKKTRQEEKAAELRVQEGKYVEAIELFLQGGLPARAAQVMNQYDVKTDSTLQQAIATALMKAEIYEKAGDFFEKLGMYERAIEAYKKGNAFRRAVPLARRAYPGYVVDLELSWADWLVSQKCVDQALNHYVEARAPGRAIEEAIRARLWTKAVQMCETLDPHDPQTRRYFSIIARHYEEAQQYAEAEKFHMKAQDIVEAVQMYVRAGRWEQAHRCAKDSLSIEDQTKLYVSQALEMERLGRYSDAERLYLKVNEVDSAIHMYKKARLFNDMIRIVKSHRIDLLDKANASLAHLLEKEQQYKPAEKYWVEAGKWENAVNMYKNVNLWDDAIRVSKQHGGGEAAKAVIFQRAIQLGTEAGVKLLVRFSLVDAGIEFAISKAQFDVAEDWAQAAAPSKLEYCFLKHGMYLEDRGKFTDAETYFMKANKVSEIIDMYVHAHLWPNALRVAESHDPSSIPKITIAQAKVAFERKDFQSAEAYIAQAGAWEVLVNLYMDAEMYAEAQRIAKQYVPHRVVDINQRIGPLSRDPIVAGRLYEDCGDYAAAINSYLHAKDAQNQDMLSAAWLKAVKLAASFARDRLYDTLHTATGNLCGIGKFDVAGELLEQHHQFENAVNVYIQGQLWDRAQALADKLSPEQSDNVKHARARHLLNRQDGGDQLVHIDRQLAIINYVNQNQWDKALALAQQEQGEEVCRMYAAQYIAFLTQQADFQPLLGLRAIQQYGMDTSNAQTYAVYTHFARLLLPLIVADPPNEIAQMLGEFRNGLFQIVANLRSPHIKSQVTFELQRELETFLNVIHVYSMQPIYKSEGFHDYAAQLLLTLARYVEVIPADKAFFDGGIAAKNVGWRDTAFLFLNRFLDLRDAIDEGQKTTSNIDNLDFVCAPDIPFDFPIPDRKSVPEDVAEDVKTWVLEMAVSVSDPTLQTSTDTGEELWEGAVRSRSGEQYEACAITGWRIKKAGCTRCKSCNRPANIEDWNKFVMKFKQCPWCRAPQTSSYTGYS